MHHALSKIESDMQSHMLSLMTIKEDIIKYWSKRDNL